MLIDEFKKAKMYALKEKNEDAKAIYSVLINKCMLALIDKREKGVEITDADYVQIVNKTLKELSDEKEAYAKAGNEAKVASISAQEEICKKYLPTMMSKEEIRNEISKLEDKSIPSVMKHFKMNFAGKVDMGLVNKIAKSL
ncbi:MAG: GatB/YqeY domain-containing protein [Bacillales bacterium]|nr:GatB/YqeY domain-containing protein [Erysipelotrichaceae bacterium]MDD6250851.1 GatB/YqeY domain-containing protein [Bacillales bacterium]